MNWAWLWYFFAFGGLCVAVYILVRFGSIAYFRTRNEFENDSIRKPKFMKRRE